VYSGAYKSNDPCGDAAISGRILNRLARSSGMSVKIQPVPECGRALPTEGSSFAIRRRSAASPFLRNHASIGPIAVLSVV